MDSGSSEGSEARFAAYVEALGAVLARISHSGVDFRVAERERTGERPKKAAVVG
jgi:hypothetical protein